MRKSLSRKTGSNKVADKKFQTYCTPQPLFDKLDDIFNFTVDACASDKNHKCKNYWTEKTDCRRKDWIKERAFVNPPFEHLPTILRCATTAELAVVVCIGSSITRKYFQKSPPRYILSIESVKFLHPSTGKEMKNPYPTGCFLAVYGEITNEQVQKIFDMGWLIFEHRRPTKV